MVFDPALAPIAMNPAAETLFGVSHLNEAAVGAMLRNNEWLLRMVESCLISGQDLADAEAKLSLGSRMATVSAEVSPLLAAGEQAAAQWCCCMTSRSIAVPHRRWARLSPTSSCRRRGSRTKSKTR